MKMGSRAHVQEGSLARKTLGETTHSELTLRMMRVLATKLAMRPTVRILLQKEGSKIFLT